MAALVRLQQVVAAAAAQDRQAAAVGDRLHHVAAAAAAQDRQAAAAGDRLHHVLVGSDESNDFLINVSVSNIFGGSLGVVDGRCWVVLPSVDWCWGISSLRT